MSRICDQLHTDCSTYEFAAPVRLCVVVVLVLHMLQQSTYAAVFLTFSSSPCKQARKADTGYKRVACRD